MTNLWPFAMLIAVSASASLLHNGDFEAGIEGWSTNHGWYAQPKDAGLSEIVVADGEGRADSKALKIIGGGKRGLAMQVLPAYPGKYRVSAWIKCEDLDAGNAGVLVEWMDNENTWMSGEPVGDVTGTEDWQQFEAVVEAPAKTRSVHFDLRTTAPNEGVVWFDDIEFERVASDLPMPEPPRLSARTADGSEESLQVTWDKSDVTEGTVTLLIFCEPEPIADTERLVPAAVADSLQDNAVIRSLENGRTYYLAARAVNADGESSEVAPQLEATVRDRQAPRPGWIEAQRAGDASAVTIGWSPHVLDFDVTRVHLCLPATEGNGVQEIASSDVADLYGEPRPLYCTEPWLHREVEVPGDAGRIGVWCEDEAGNTGAIEWAQIVPAYEVSPDRPAPCETWFAAPTTQLPQDADPGAGEIVEPRLSLLRGQAKGIQLMVKPGTEMSRVGIRFEPLNREDGEAQIDPTWLAYHFVNYVQLEKNSRATPEDELIWPAPAEYPDELSDDRYRDLPADELQPIYLRVTAPRDAEPGNYTGHCYLHSDEGSTRFTLDVTVRDIRLPERPHLKFVYWLSWSDPCKEFGVEPHSADGWRALARIGDLIAAHHQHVAVVSWGMIDTWRTPDGALVHDFSTFDRFIETMQERGVDQLYCLSHIGSRYPGGWTCPTMRSHRHRVRSLTTGEEERIDVLEVLPDFADHIDDLGLTDRFAVHVADEPIPQNIESYRELAAKVKQAAPQLRRIDAIHVPDLSDSLEIWVPQLNYFDQWLDQYRQAQQEGNEIWFYVAWVPQGHYPNRMIDNEAIKPRVLHWFNAMHNTSGYLHWALNRWSISLMSLQSPGDQYICWPSERFIADSSLRYEAEREGLEDCELMFMLRDALVRRGLSEEDAQKQVNEIARGPVRDFEEYTRSWKALESARQKMMERLEQLSPD